MNASPREDLAKLRRRVDNFPRRREMKPLKKVVRIKEERPAKEKVSREEAETLLADHHGQLRPVVGDPPAPATARA